MKSARFLWGSQRAVHLRGIFNTIRSLALAPIGSRDKFELRSRDESQVTVPVKDVILVTTLGSKREGPLAVEGPSLQSHTSAVPC